MPQNRLIVYEQKEFTLEIPTNSLGMRNPEIAPAKPDSIYRILCLGDSYTEGDGAAYGYSWPRQLESILNAASTEQRYEVINAGKNGSDIVYAAKIYRERLSEFRPDLVLVAINDSDIDDIIQRGGVERFKPDGNTRYRSGPWYEGLYARSHVFRFIIHVPLMKNKLFLGPLQYARAKEQVVQIIDDSMEQLEEVCRSSNTQLRMLPHPLPWELDPAKNKAASKYIVQPSEFFRKTSKLNAPGLFEDRNTYDLYPDLLRELSGKPYTEYAWPLNGHFNASGYRIFAELVAGHLASDTGLSFMNAD